MLPLRMVCRRNWYPTRRALFSFHSTRAVAEGTSGGGGGSSSTSGSSSKPKHFKVIYVYMCVYIWGTSRCKVVWECVKGWCEG